MSHGVTKVYQTTLISLFLIASQKFRLIVSGNLFGALLGLITETIAASCMCMIFTFAYNVSCWSALNNYSRAATILCSAASIFCTRHSIISWRAGQAEWGTCERSHCYDCSYQVWCSVGQLIISMHWYNIVHDCMQYQYVDILIVAALNCYSNYADLSFMANVKIIILCPVASIFFG